MDDLFTKIVEWSLGEEMMQGATLIGRGVIVRATGEHHARALVFDHPTLGKFGVWYNHATNGFDRVPLIP